MVADLRGRCRRFWRPPHHLGNSLILLIVIDTVNDGHGTRPARPQPAARVRGAGRRAPRHPGRGQARPDAIRRQQRPAPAACGLPGRPVPAHPHRHGADRTRPRAGGTGRHRPGRGPRGGRAQPAIRAGDRARRLRGRRVGLCRVRAGAAAGGAPARARARAFPPSSGTPTATGRWRCSTRTGRIWRSASFPSRRRG